MNEQETEALIERVIAAVSAEIDKRLADFTPPQPSGKALTGRVSPELMDGLFNSIKSYVTRNVKPLAERMKDLEERKLMHFEGGHEPATLYRKGAVVQRGNALHVALIDTQETPGSSSHWRRIGQQ